MNVNKILSFVADLENVFGQKKKIEKIFSRVTLVYIVNILIRSYLATEELLFHFIDCVGQLVNQVLHFINLRISFSKFAFEKSFHLVYLLGHYSRYLLHRQKLSERNCCVVVLAVALNLEYKDFDYNFRFQTNGHIHNILTDNAEK